MVVKVLKTNSVQTTKDGLDFDASDEVWIIAHGIKVSSKSADGVFVGFANDTLENFGKIHSYSAHRAGVYIDTGPLDITTIFNEASAVINGATDAIYAKVGSFILANNGTVIGNIDDHDGANVTIVNHGKIENKVLLGTGNDKFYGKGGTSGAIIAAGGNDRIIAGKGNVSITVGYGNDSITAGPGHDRFIFNSPIAGQIEKIGNFKHGLDKIVLSETDFHGLGPLGTLTTAHFHLNAPVNGHAQIDYFGTGYLEYCPNGNAGPAYIFAWIANHASAIVSASDFHLIA
jgi:Ca2+-binding RTX toxin-like protein